MPAQRVEEAAVLDGWDFDDAAHQRDTPARLVEAEERVAALARLTPAEAERLHGRRFFLWPCQGGKGAPGRAGLRRRANPGGGAPGG